MISKAKVKYIKSLQVKKYRKQEQCFLVEGTKSVEELLHSDFEVLLLLGTEPFIEKQDKGKLLKGIEVIVAKERELAEIGTFQSNDSLMAVARMKPNRVLEFAKDEYGLVLDDIRDPGNLGTIIRTADWYGIHKIIASEETADFYNPKVISASMGSFCRVRVYYTSLVGYISASPLPLYGTFLNGEDVHQASFESSGLIVVGNESNGISHEVANLIRQKITIPRYGRAESLNAGVATAVILDNLRRSKK